MHITERQIGWYQTYTAARRTDSGEKAVGTYAETGFNAILTAVQSLTDTTIFQSHAPDAWPGVKTPEEDLLFALHADSIPAIGIAALRRSISDGYRQLFGYPETVASAYGVDARTVLKYSEALSIVPADAPPGRLWIPDRYLQ